MEAAELVRQKRTAACMQMFAWIGVALYVLQWAWHGMHKRVYSLYMSRLATCGCLHGGLGHGWALPCKPLQQIMKPDAPGNLRGYLCQLHLPMCGCVCCVQEDPTAGEPGRRLRERYRIAARHAATTGEPTCLIINDLDMGTGMLQYTDRTVNTQNVAASLMAICDDPTTVGGGGAWAADSRLLPRVPIFTTANDLTPLYAPLVREGRMDKFFFAPTRQEVADAVAAIFSDLDAAETAALLAAFPRQPLDFFAATRSRLTDAAVRAWLAAAAAGGAELNDVLLGEEAEYQRDAAAWRNRDRPALRSRATLADALAAGASLQQEQQFVMDINLKYEYVRGLLRDQQAAAARRQERPSSRRARERMARDRAAAAAGSAAPAQSSPTVTEETAAYWAYLAASSSVSQARVAEVEAAAAAAAEAEAARASPLVVAAEAAAAEAAALEEVGVGEARGWPLVTTDQVHAALREGTAAVLDVRTAKEWDWVGAALYMPL
jgi:hypothetical protein